MSSRKKKTSSSSGGASQANNTHSHSSSSGQPRKQASNGSAKEHSNSWGWGRPSVPSPDRDVFAYQHAPWKLIGALAVGIPLAATYAIVGVSWWAVLLLPAIGILTALPVLAGVLMPLSWQLDPAGAGNPERFFRFNDKAFERKYKGRKIPIEELYEAYFDEKLDLVHGDDSLLDVLYQRHQFSRSIITMSHVKFFLLQFIPELVKHTRFQDITQVREHYDRSARTHTHAHSALPLPHLSSSATGRERAAFWQFRTMLPTRYCTRRLTVTSQLSFRNRTPLPVMGS